MATTIKFKRGTAAAWTSANPTLSQGEPGFETDTGKLKIGDGATAWNSLDYLAGGAGTWGSITGTLSDQTDLQDAFDAKADAVITTKTKVGGHTLDSDDLSDFEEGKTILIEGDNTGDLTVPPSSSVDFPVGYGVVFSGFENVVAGSGVTVISSSGSLASPSDNATMVLIKKAADTWRLENGVANTTPSGSDNAVIEVSESSGIVTLDMDNKAEKIFRIYPSGGADDDFEIAFDNVPVTDDTTIAHAILFIVRSTNVNRSVTFPEGSNMYDSDQNLDNGATPLEIEGTDAASGKIREHMVGITFSKPDTNMKYMIKLHSPRSYEP
jgi:hypothetical protein